MELSLLFSCQTLQESREFLIDEVIEGALKFGLALDRTFLLQEVDTKPLIDASEESLLFYLVCDSPILLNALAHVGWPVNLITMPAVF